MFTVDRGALTHFPYHLQHVGPGAYPVHHLRLLDKDAPEAVLRLWAERQATCRPSWLVLGPDTALKFDSGAEPAASSPPHGFYRAEVSPGPADGTTVALLASDPRGDAGMGFRSAATEEGASDRLVPIRILPLDQLR